MDFSEIRRVAITALFSDDQLMGQLVLKGGNALALVYGIGGRTSLDLDFSLETDFADLTEARGRLFRALRDRFDSHGFVVFDEQLDPKPRLDGEDTKPWWGGYELRFKIIEKDKYEDLKGRLEKLRINSLPTGPTQQRTFKIDLSKHEYTAGKLERELDFFTIYVYSPEMIVIEKLRALCQQIPDYEHKGRGKPRARDFYDIHTVITTQGIDLSSAERLELIRNIFSIKEVPLAFLGRIGEFREFHRVDWPAVTSSVGTIPIRDFDFYFDYVVQQVEQLKALWIE